MEDRSGIDALREGLADINVPCETTEAGSFAETLSEQVTQPAVAAPLRIDGLSLDELSVSLDPTPRELTDAATGITAGLLAVSTYGSIAIESHRDGDELISLYPHRQVIVVPSSRIYESLNEAFDALAHRFKQNHSSLVFVTGTSATADMGATVEGVHGPGEVHVIIVEDR